MAGGGGSIEGGEPEFQVAPMIDVLLTLLIFFMAITSTEVLRVDQGINLPVAADAKKREKERGEVIVNVRYEGENKASYSFGQDSYGALEALVPKVKQAVAAAQAGIKPGGNPNVRLVIRGDERLPAKAVYDVMVVMAEAGVSDIAFAAANQP
jgi:biopolymer transport protein ExbD